MKSTDLINQVMNGYSAKDIVTSITEVQMNPLELRRFIRNVSPDLYSYLSTRGDLHDVAMEFSDKSSSVAQFMKNNELPEKFRQSVETIISEL